LNAAEVSDMGIHAAKTSSAAATNYTAIRKIVDRVLLSISRGWSFKQDTDTKRRNPPAIEYFPSQQAGFRARHSTARIVPLFIILVSVSKQVIMKNFHCQYSTI
jgi:hypothetical protein